MLKYKPHHDTPAAINTYIYNILMSDFMPLTISAQAQRDLQQEHDVVSIYKGHEVLQQISDANLIAGWEDLYTDCPWSTVFQSPEFVVTWYKHYHTAYQPLLIKYISKGKLAGLLTLALDERRNIIGAGANQAEYQVWLSAKSNADLFILQALKKLRQHYPNSKISLKYIPEGAPLSWTLKHNYWSKFCIRRDVPQPLLLIDRAQIAQELKKKNRREKINRLKRLGELKFERLTDANEFSNVLGELAIQSDFRKGAMYDKCAFQEDPFRKNFLLELYKQDLLHATVLKVDETIIASNVGFTGKSWLHLQGINTHSPFHAKHSPGILHFLMLGNLLAAEGMKVFDLTPGSDPYKETLATDFCTATELTICGQNSWLKHKLKYKLNEYLKKKLPKTGLQREKLRRFKHESELLKQKANLLKSKGLSLWLQQNIHKIKAKSKQTVLKLNHSAVTTSTNITLHRDSLSDLLLYKPTNSLTTKWEFLAEAMNRFEQGQHCYSWSENNCLLGWCWESNQKALKTSVEFDQELPADAVILYGYHTCLQVQNRLDEFILTAVAAAGKVHQDIYLLKNSNNSALYTSLAKNGLTQAKALPTQTSIAKLRL
ncbi:GNAT family N-acetyltransferase [uncultured Pontibacter sp.]|uniref:GNAT family N-acetyltransferase n=1 Tax=uncultured Pontibacter sp. TaxID=453356 RepID=UPI002630B095|nr:GNAT family N-acetyltransferase [uncultured Pontibacter sp.]